MLLAQITAQTQGWLVELSDGQQQLFPVNQFSSLKDWLREKKVAGGSLTQKDLLELETETITLDQYLTENLNLPFVIGPLEDWQENIKSLPWKLHYEGYQPGKDEYSVESLLTVGNGYLGIRGTTPEMEICSENYPATYLASLYNTVASPVGDQQVTNEDFVNIPNLQKMYLIIDGEKIDYANNKLLSFSRTLDLKTGLFESSAVIETKQGKQIKIDTKRFASMAAVQQVHLTYRFTPLNFSDELFFVSEADASVYNFNVARYRDLTREHLTDVTLQAEGAGIFVDAYTNQSKILVRQQSFLRSQTQDLTTLKNDHQDLKVTQTLKIAARKGEASQFEKVILIEQYRPDTIIPPFTWQQTLPSFTAAFEASRLAWEQLWQKAEMVVEGDLMSQKLLHLHTYHLLVAASPNGNQHLDASITARGLHGEAYRGHIFWDELFILPFYFNHFPETAKEILLYRYRRLAKAKENAKEIGLKGAMYPWQSGLDGSEQSQKLHLNPISGKWKEDHSRLQRHVSLAIAYNVWQYYQQTQDQIFMEQAGLEMLLEIAHFWQSLAQYDEITKRYSIEGVMGPDEFHESYPNAQNGGLKNNTYTNMMVVWLFEIIAKLQDTFDPNIFKAIQTKTQINAQTLHEMQQMKQHLTLEINPDGILAQFEGYFDLAELDWDGYRQKYGNIYRMDRILNAEGKSADQYQVAKQADTLMVFYNLAKNQIDQILTDLNYTLPTDYLEKNLAYYLARTSHGSTLSRIVHAKLASLANQPTLAWQLYQEALYSDYRDIQGGTTAEGIHAGVMAATLDVPVTTFAGIDLRQDTIVIQPNLPEKWTRLAFHFTWRNILFQISVSHDTFKITASEDCSILFITDKIMLQKNQTKTITY